MEIAQRASLRLAEATGQRLAAVWDLHEAGLFDPTRFRSLAVAVVAQANAAAVQLADMALAAEVAHQLGSLSAPLGLLPTALQTNHRRILADIERLLDEDPELDDLAESRRVRLARLGRSEPLITVATTVQTGMVRRGVQGWTRLPDADPCKLCRSWADGVVRPPWIRMARHPGCGCIQQPVF